MINSATGDILKADVEAVVNTVNTVGVMGKGLALQFKRRYPENFKAYKRACDAGEVQIGRMFVTETHELSGPRLIINFPTKKHWRADSRMEYVREGLKDLVRVIQEHRISSIAIPPLGSGNGGLDWGKVRPLVEAALGPIPALRVEIFDPVNAHFGVAKPESVRMTNSVALLLSLMLAYSKQRSSAEPWEDDQGVSHLEVQKLMYFASRFVPEMKLRFAQGTYGPYSDAVRAMLAHIEGAYVEGFGDGNDRVLNLVPIRVTDEGRAALRAFRPQEYAPERFREAVEGVLRIVEGFEGAYPLELLSSVDWARSSIASDDDGEIVRFVQGWTKRKGRMFTGAHITTALEHLAA
ncbi:macro domain-containing protein [Agromyces sp. C10]|uniref:type II toxin-antitoxin system antitoxin DNA ADP-ribosyl glycohydrolase DarG n=1 Tax=Agromyces sp. C10 TaxID=2935077 RepID=UPI00200ABFB4|nr:macro domain-containing protein [Agromyces sp. C10]MCK8608519.1 macro domain-containing protein [Agromyces sp. C10]